MLAAADGKAIYDKSCGHVSQHGHGEEGAEAWRQGCAQGRRGLSLTASAIKGEGIMKPRVGTKLSDEENKAAID